MWSIWSSNVPLVTYPLNLSALLRTKFTNSSLTFKWYISDPYTIKERARKRQLPSPSILITLLFWDARRWSSVVSSFEDFWQGLVGLWSWELFSQTSEPFISVWLHCTWQCIIKVSMCVSERCYTEYAHLYMYLFKGRILAPSFHTFLFFYVLVLQIWPYLGSWCIYHNP